MSCGLKVDGLGVFARLVAPPIIPVDTGATAAITFVPSAPRAVFNPLLALVCGGGANWREELMYVSGDSQKTLSFKFRSSALFCVARACVNKEVELLRDVWVHGRLLL